MPRLPFPSVFAVAFLMSAAIASAAEELPAKAGPTSVPSARPRILSPALAAQLASAAPKYAPPSVETKPTDPPPADAREKDQPRNTIIRLPSYVVEAPRVRLPNHRDILTTQGRLSLALKRNPGLHFNPLWFLGSNNGAALGMLEEEYRLERIAEAMDLTSLLSTTDPNHPTAQRAVHQLMLRPSAHGPGSWVSGGGPFQVQR